MGEENKEEKQEEKRTAENNDMGNRSKAIGLVDRAHIAAERLEAALKKQEELIEREETIVAKRALGGYSEAGIVSPKPKEETPEELAARVRRGEFNPLAV